MLRCGEGARVCVCVGGASVVENDGSLKRYHIVLLVFLRGRQYTISGSGYPAFLSPRENPGGRDPFLFYVKVVVYLSISFENANALAS